jgi:hypothetical protein
MDSEPDLNWLEELAEKSEKNAAPRHTHHEGGERYD